MTQKEEKVMRPTVEFVAEMLKKRNKGTEDCTLTSDIAKKLGISAPDLNQFLIDQKIMVRKERRLQMTSRYNGQGYTKNRSQFKFNSRGELKEVVYPVWTPKGVEFLFKVLNIKK